MHLRSFLYEEAKSSNVLPQRNEFVKSVRKQYGNPYFLFFCFFSARAQSTKSKSLILQFYWFSLQSKRKKFFNYLYNLLLLFLGWDLLHGDQKHYGDDALFQRNLCRELQELSSVQEKRISRKYF